MEGGIYKIKTNKIIIKQYINANKYQYYILYTYCLSGFIRRMQK